MLRRVVFGLAVVGLTGCGGSEPTSLAARLALSVSTVELAAQTGGADPTTAIVTLTNTGGGTLDGLAASVAYSAEPPSDWLSASLSGTSAPATVSLHATTGTLPPGTYTATVSVEAPGAGNGPLPIAVTSVVGAAPSIGLDASSIVFTGMTCVAPAPRTVNVTNAGTGSLTGLGASVSHTTGSGWLSAIFGAATAPAVLTLSPNPTGLLAGSYAASVTVASPVGVNSPQAVAVSLAVESRPVVQVSAPGASFTATQGGSSPASKTLNVTNGCATADALMGLAATVAYTGTGGWLTATLSQTTAPATLTLGAALGTLTPGTYHASVTIASAAPNAVESVVPVDLIVSAFALTTNVAPSDGGTVTRTPDQGSYPPGTPVEIQATPRLGWAFVAWTGDLVSSTNPATLTMDGDKAITANFALVPPALDPAVIDAGGLVTLTWNFLPPCGAAGCPAVTNDRFELEESTSPSGGFVLLRTLTADVSHPQFTVTSVFREAGTYFYRVRAVTQYGVTLYSAVQSVTSTISAPPVAPAGLVASAASSSNIDVSWSNAATNASQTELERCTGAGCSNFERIAVLGANSSSYTLRDSFLPANTSTSYRVRVLNAAGYSAYSNVATATTMP